VFTDSIDRHKFKDNMSESARPTVEQAFAGFGCQGAIEWVEKLNLFWIDDFSIISPTA
jgi:hypothetical protein